jgi:predicted Zn-dependent peptidase
LKADVNKAVKILGDLISNSKIDPNELEIAKEEVSHEHEDNIN